jgi:protein phosphatase
MQLRRSLRGLEREGFRYVHVLHTPEDVQKVTFERQPLWNNRKSDKGPFDIIGDIHGCYDELIELLGKLGYGTSDVSRIVPPPGRKAVFLGDLGDRGPRTPAVLRLVMSMVAAGTALCVPGNHDVKLLRKLRGKNVQITHGLAETLAQLESSPELLPAIEKFLDSLIGHYVLDECRLVVAHAGMKERYIGRASGRVREFALYGETTGETDEFGLPVRYNWAAEYRGSAHIVYGHTPVLEADWLNRTINIDTGCVFGGKLTALRWPEKEIVSVPAKQTYAEPSKPFLAAESVSPGLNNQQLHDDVLDLADVTGKRIITTRLQQSVTIREENATAALEVMSRFAVDAKWLIYLPPTMSPTETTDLPDMLEHPQQAFEYFRSNGVGRVICEEKHMGSRAVVVLCRDEAVALRRFGIRNDGAGIIYTRMGRRFFDKPIEAELLEILRRKVTAADLWNEFASDWFCLDCELMPWSAKAQELLQKQYAAVGSAARAAVAEAVSVLEQAAGRGGTEIASLLENQRDRLKRVSQYVDAYRHYCWPVNGVSDLKLAPFHLLATEAKVHVDRDHLWHMQTLARLASGDPSPIIATTYRIVNTTDPIQIEEGISWWEELTAHGGEGMVVKPLAFVERGKRGLVQPAVKCRGKEYLRIIYGPEYDAPANLGRLRSRGLAGKRSLAIREFALGIEALERFVRREPLRRVHECVFGVLAMESEPVDPRL